LTDRIFAAGPVGPADATAFPEERARELGEQLCLQLEQLASRHAISYEIRRDIDYEETMVRSKLDQIEQLQLYYGRGTKFESDLIRQLHALTKERWAEEVACWRDTGRILSDICEHWSAYSDQKRKARLMQFDL